MSIYEESRKYHEKKYGFGYRHIQYFLMFFSIIIFYGQRTTLSVAIIAMTDDNPPDPSIPTYPEWTNTDTMLSSFFWGYIIPQITAGQLGERFGPKWFVVGTMVMGSMFMCLLPLAAHLFGSTGVIICRVLQGLNQGFLFPSTHILISKWTPVYEMSRVSSIVYGSAGISVVIAMLISGAVCGSKLGWPYVFYFYGAGGVVWAAVFALIGENSPAQHKRISKKERKYIEDGSSVDDLNPKIPTPWLKVMTSLPVWAILLSACGQVWIMYTFLTEMPSFLSKFMNFDIHSNSELSSLPYLAYFLLALTTASVGDKLIAYKILSTGTTRKLINSLGLLIPGIALFILGFINNDQEVLAIILLVVSVAVSSFINSGSNVNIIDVAPNHAGSIMGLVNGSSQIFSIMAPLTVAFLGDDKTDIVLWRKVFWLASGMSVAFGLFFIVFGSGEVQEWDKEGKEIENDYEEPTTDL